MNKEESTLANGFIQAFLVVAKGTINEYTTDTNSSTTRAVVNKPTTKKTKTVVRKTKTKKDKTVFESLLSKTIIVIISFMIGMGINEVLAFLPSIIYIPVGVLAGACTYLAGIKYFHRKLTSYLTLNQSTSNDKNIIKNWKKIKKDFAPEFSTIDTSISLSDELESLLKKLSGREYNKIKAKIKKFLRANKKLMLELIENPALTASYYKILEHYPSSVINVIKMIDGIKSTDDKLEKIDRLDAALDDLLLTYEKEISLLDKDHIFDTEVELIVLEKDLKN